ncbi:MAG: hypothetical protein HYS55_02810, partial [Candidatus Omnitrophica bacterium]|nr:hypothetical protein [Candidatus Omnitrophota bacterium]
CHINEKKYFLESVHAPVMKAGKFSECISCHGNHGVKPADKILYRETCTQCHEKTSPPAQLGEKLFQFMSESEGELKEATEWVRQASIQGIFVEEEAGILEETKTNAISMEPVQHSLSLERISKLYEKLREDARAIKASIQKKKQVLRWRKLALIPIWAFVVVMALALWFKYKQLKGKH